MGTESRRRRGGLNKRGVHVNEFDLSTTVGVDLNSTDRSYQIFLCLRKMKIFFVVVLAFEAATISSLHQPLFPLGQQSSGRLTADCSSPTDSASLFAVHNNCPYPLWAASIPGGGRRLNKSDIWIIDSAITGPARIWARTNCVFNSSGSGSCQTGDCGGLLRCQSFGTPPNTIAEFGVNSSNNLDFFDISLVDGFNVPIKIKPSGDCNQSPGCTANIVGECPSELKAPGGCNSPCTVFRTKEYCCTSINSTCAPTDYSRFFKERCPNTYTYPQDNNASFTCPSGTSYEVVFCP